MKAATKGALIAVFGPFLVAAITYVCVMIPDSERGIIVREAPPALPEAKEPDRLQFAGSGGGNLYVLRDTVTGREFLVNHNGGVIEILPAGK